MPSSNDDLKVTSTSLYCLRENDKIMTYIYHKNEWQRYIKEWLSKLK